MRSFAELNTERGSAVHLLHGHRFLLRAGLSFGNLFAWVFVFHYFFILSGSSPRALFATLIVYALSQGISIVLTPIAAAHLSRGTKSALIWALLSVAAAFVLLGTTMGGIFGTHETSLEMIVIYAFLLGAYRALYYVPYELNRVALGSPHSHHESRVYYEFLLALLPAFAGATIFLESYAPTMLLYAAAALIGVSAIPLISISSARERFSYSYGETFRELFAMRNRYALRASLLEGIEGAALFLVWPLAVFLLVGRSYALLGVLFTATLLGVLLFRILRRNWFPNYSSRKFSTVTVVTIAMSGWIARFAAGAPFAVVIADVYAHEARAPRSATHDVSAFEQAADGGSYVDEQTALKEMGLALGRILLVACAGVTLLLVSSVTMALASAFVLTALAAGLAAALQHRRVERYV